MADNITLKDGIKSDMVEITTEELARRKAADDYARGSLRLEGFVPSDFSDAMTRRYIKGEITREELTAAILAHHGR